VRASDLSIREDDDISPGGVIIETEAGSIDARLETQLDALERAMFGQ
jgi:flagellar biosynthesis/type III secretory pathway protein FliH